MKHFLNKNHNNKNNKNNVDYVLFREELPYR